MRLGGEPVGRWGIALLAVTGVAGLVLGWHGWTTRAATATPPLAGATATAPASPAAHRQPGRLALPPPQRPQARRRPLDRPGPARSSVRNRTWGSPTRCGRARPVPPPA